MHRITGFWSFWLMLAHVVLLVVGYSQQAGVSLLAQAWDLVWNYPGMLLATAGTLLLVLVVVTSIRRARRRLRPPDRKPQHRHQRIPRRAIMQFTQCLTLLQMTAAKDEV